MYNENDLPLISVIIPSRVGEAILTLSSIKKQSYGNIEIIIEYDDRNEGASTVRNRGVEKAKGDYIFFCDNDLFLDLDCLKNLYMALCQNPDAGWAFGKFYIDGNLYNQDKDVAIPEKFTVDWVEYFYCISTMSLIRSSARPRFDPAMLRCNDWDLWLDLHSRGHNPVFCDKVLFFTKTRKNGISTGEDQSQIEWTNRLYQKYRIPVFKNVQEKNRLIKNLSA